MTAGPLAASRVTEMVTDQPAAARLRVTWWHPSVTDYRAPLFALMAREHRLHLVLLKPGAGPMPVDIDAHVATRRDANVTTHPLRLDWRHVAALCARIARSDVFVSSFIGNGYTLAGLMWARLHGVPVVVWEEMQQLPRQGRGAAWRRSLLRWAARRVDAWFVMGEPQRRGLLDMGVAPERIFRSAEAPARRYAEVNARALDLPFGADRPVVLYLGRLIPIKGVDVLLDAMACLQREHPGAALVLAGDGPERAVLEARARALGLSDTCFLGHVGDDAHKAWLLRRAAVLAVSSVPLGDWREGGPLVIPEALSAGTPVVCTEACGNTVGLVQITGCGEVVPPGDAEALAGALARWLRPRIDRDTVRGRAAALPDHAHQAHTLTQALHCALTVRGRTAARAPT